MVSCCVDIFLRLCEFFSLIPNNNIIAQSELGEVELVSELFVQLAGSAGADDVWRLVQCCIEQLEDLSSVILDILQYDYSWCGSGSGDQV